jgi:hypothetical protein
MLRDRWARDAAMTRPAIAEAQPAARRSLEPWPAVADALPDHDEDLLASQEDQHDTDPFPDDCQDGPELELPSAPQLSVPVRWECPDIDGGQREVLELLHLGRVDLAAVLQSRDSRRGTRRAS